MKKAILTLSALCLFSATANAGLDVPPSDATFKGVLSVKKGGSGTNFLTGFLVGNGTSAFTAVPTIPNSGLTNNSLTIGSTTVSLGSTTTILSGLTSIGIGTTAAASEALAVVGTATFGTPLALSNLAVGSAGLAIVGTGTTPPAYGAVDLSATGAVTGTLAETHGGTGLSSVGTSGQCLKSNGTSIEYGACGSTSEIDPISCCGADPTNTTDSTTAFQDWWTACMASTGYNCHIPAGHYKLSSSLVWDFANNRDKGSRIYGDGQNATLLDFSGTTGNGLSIIDSNDVGFFYGRFENFGVKANNSSGPAVMLGQEDYSDALNSFSFRDIWIKNLAAAADSSGLELNQVYSSDFANLTISDGCSDAYGACSSAGDALKIRQSSFNRLSGSFSAAKNGIHFTGGYSFGNVIDNPDIEVVYNGIYIDSSNAKYNTVHGGTFVWCATTGSSCTGGGGYAAIATAGTSNILDNSNFGASNPFTAVGTTMIGISLRSMRAVTTPSVPASTTKIYNTTGHRVLINAYGGAITQACMGSEGTTCITVNSTVSYVLNPADQTNLTYTGTPSWVWTPVD